MEKDIVVIGGGPGGYAAAIRAAQLGGNVTLIEKDKLGGTCLNRGCIPTKTLYRNAEILNTLKNIESFGINIDGYSIDVYKVHERKNMVINQLRDGILQLLKGNKIEVINGIGRIINKNLVEVIINDGSRRKIETKNIIIASGSKPALIPIPGIEIPGVFTSETMLNFNKIPDRLFIIGGGIIGMEFAGIFNAMGSKVTVVEFMPGILQQVDNDLTKRFTVFLKKRGIDVYTSTRVNKIEKSSESFIITTEGKKGTVTFEADAVLMATGRIPDVDGLNLNEVGIDFEKKGIKVDEYYMTNIFGIYAIGDVNGKCMLAHAASHQGITAAEKIMGVKKDIDSPVVPNCIFVFPEISSVGLTEEEAKNKGINYKTSKFMFGANGKALALGEGEGLIKVIASGDDDTILGVHIMGPHASDLIHEGVLAISKGMKCREFASIVHAHPTLSEAFFEAIMGVNGEAIHMIKPRRN